MSVIGASSLVSVSPCAQHGPRTGGEIPRASRPHYSPVTRVIARESLVPSPGKLIGCGFPDLGILCRDRFPNGLRAPHLPARLSYPFARESGFHMQRVPSRRL